MTGKILIVDDLLPNIKLLEAKLSSEYYNVLTAKSGIEAIEILDKELVDVILLDIMMPEIDGFETCRRIKTNPKTSHIPIVMVTALSDIDDRVNGLKAGADDFLTKPINEIALFARIKSLLRLKTITDELMLRNKSLNALGANTEELNLDKSFLQGAKIVAYDDDVAESGMIKKALEENGAIVALYKKSEDLNKEITPNTDMLLISNALTDNDALRMCSQIRNIEGLKKIPIMLGLDDEQINIMPKAFEIGVNDYIISPIDINELIARCNTQIKRKKFQEKLSSELEENLSLAIKDKLTGVYNRRYYDIHCKQLIENNNKEKKPIAVCVLDIDHFKKINDTYGHKIGDDVIKQVASITANSIRVTDNLIRYGGEEFVVIINNIIEDQALKIAERIRRNISEYEFIKPDNSGTFSVTISIGITMFRSDDNEITIFQRADSNLYQAKQTGRNKAVIASE